VTKISTDESSGILLTCLKILALVIVFSSLPSKILNNNNSNMASVYEWNQLASCSKTDKKL
jgi:hypothetical protein